MEHKGYFFNDELFNKLNLAMEKSFKEILEGTGIPYGTWRHYLQAHDIPVVALIEICNANSIPIAHFICTGREKDVLLGQRHYVKAVYDDAVFLNREFGYEVTMLQDRSVKDLCDLVGVSTYTFYRNFRYQNTIGSTFSIKSLLSICNKTKTYPMDFLICKNMEVPVLDGYSRKHEVNAKMLVSGNRGSISQNARLKRDLQAEKEKVKELEAEVERLKRALYARRNEGEDWTGKAAEKAL